MSEVMQPDPRLDSLIVSPPKLLTTLNCAAAIVLLFLTMYLSPSASNASFAATYGEFLDAHLYNIIFGIFFLFTIVSLFDLKTFSIYSDRASSVHVSVRRYVFPGKTTKVMATEIDRISPSRLPGFISAAYRSYNLKLKNGSKLSMPYDYTNSERAIILLQSAIEAGKR
jgi:hypothetical protein